MREERLWRRRQTPTEDHQTVIPRRGERLQRTFSLTNSKRLLYYGIMLSDTQSVQMMNCRHCGTGCQRFGKHRNGLRRFRCPNCMKTYTESHERTLGAMYVSQDRAVLALQLLLEGNSIRSTERITGMDRNTIMRLLVLAGEKCQRLMQRRIEYLTVRDVEVDEIWGYVGKKEHHKRSGEESGPQIGDAYCFVAMERNSKLVLAFHLGKRNRVHTEVFLSKLRYATSDARFQLSS